MSKHSVIELLKKEATTTKCHLNYHSGIDEKPEWLIDGQKFQCRLMLSIAKPNTDNGCDGVC